MAIYRGIAQNTYVFKTETTLNFNQDLTNPLRSFAFPTIKYFDDTDRVIRTVVLTPHSGSNSLESSLTVNTGSVRGESTSSTSYAESVARSNVVDYISSINRGYLIPVIVDGDTYYGYTSPSYKWGDYESTVSKKIVYAFTNAKYIVYEASSQIIITKNLNLQKQTIASRDFSTGGSGGTSNPYYYNLPYQIIILKVEKTTDDLILAFEIEYENTPVEITGSITDLEYSLDNGLTWNNAALGVANADQIKFRNNGSSALTITGNNGDTALSISVAAGATSINYGIFAATTFTVA